jgi:hypothetical protein
MEIAGDPHRLSAHPIPIQVFFTGSSLRPSQGIPRREWMSGSCSGLGDRPDQGISREGVNLPIRLGLSAVLDDEPGRRRVHHGIPCGIISRGCGFGFLSEHESGARL